MAEDTKQDNSPLKLNKANLTVYKVFAKNYTVWGIPIELFSVGVAVSAIILFVLFWLTGIIFFIAYTYGMYKIHEHDPRGFDVWRKTYLFLGKNKKRKWLAAKHKSTTIYYI